jgi:hypothetical protein
MISATADHDEMIEEVPDVFSGWLIETATTISAKHTSARVSYAGRPLDSASIHHPLQQSCARLCHDAKVDGAPVIRIDSGLDKAGGSNVANGAVGELPTGLHGSGCHDLSGARAGPALSEMVASVWRDVPTRSLEDFRSIQDARAWLASHSSL